MTEMCVTDMEEDVNSCDVTYRSLTSVADQLISLSSGTDNIPRQYGPQETAPTEEHSKGDWHWSIPEGTEAPSPCSLEVMDIAGPSSDTGPHRLDQFILSFLKKSPRKSKLSNTLSSTHAMRNENKFSQLQEKCDSKTEEVFRNSSVELCRKCEKCNFQFHCPKMYRNHMSRCHLKKYSFMTKPAMSKRMGQLYSKTVCNQDTDDTEISNMTRGIKTDSANLQLKESSQYERMFATRTLNNGDSKTSQYVTKRKNGKCSSDKSLHSDSFGSGDCESDRSSSGGSTAINVDCLVSSKLKADREKKKSDNGDCGRLNFVCDEAESCCARTLPYDRKTKDSQKLHRNTVPPDKDELFDTADNGLELAPDIEDNIASVYDRLNDDFAARPSTDAKVNIDLHGKYHLNINSQDDNTGVHCARTKPISQHVLEIYSESDKATNIKSKLQYWIGKGRQLLNEDSSIDADNILRGTSVATNKLHVQPKTSTYFDSNLMLCSLENHEEETTKSKSVIMSGGSSAGEENENCGGACAGSDVLSSIAADMSLVPRSDMSIASINVSSATPIPFSSVNLDAASATVNEGDTDQYVESAFASPDSESAVTDVAKSGNFKTPDDLYGITSVQTESHQSSAPSLSIQERPNSNTYYRELVPELSDKGWILLDGNVSDYIRTDEDNDSDDDDDDDDDVHSKAHDKGLPVGSVTMYSDDILCSRVSVIDGTCARTRLYFNVRSSSNFCPQSLC